MTNYSQHVNTKSTSQSEPIPGAAQVQNSAGGYTFQLDCFGRLQRFLILGNEGGTYYATEKKLTRENAECVLVCAKQDAARTVAMIVQVSDDGRAPKNDPALFALALVAKLGDDAARKLAWEALPKVARIGTHLLHFTEYVNTLGGWGRSTKKAFAKWFVHQELDKLAYQLVKYQNRDGWRMADVLRLAHPRHVLNGTKALPDLTADRETLFQWVLKGGDVLPKQLPDSLAIVRAFEQAKLATDEAEIVQLILEHGLPRECIPTEMLTKPKVWEALLVHMPMTAMIRNLATMTRIGLIAPMSDVAKEVVSRLGDEQALKKARVHPIAVLAALLTYKSGHSARGSSTWSPVAKIVDALDSAFYKTFKYVEPTGKRYLLGLDVSGSMGGGEIAGVPGLTPRDGSAAMSLVTAAVEEDTHFIGFTAAGGGYGGQWGGGTPSVTVLPISKRQRLDDVIRSISNLPFGGTDCALPMLYAMKNKIPVDVFCVYTDNETWAGNIHPSQALKQYRDKMGIDAKLVVVGMTATDFTIADPKDGGMMDVVGFDTAAPQMIAEFAKSKL